MNFSDFKCEIVELRDENYKVWKETILLHLEWMDIDCSIQKDEPHYIIETSLLDDVDKDQHLY